MKRRDITRLFGGAAMWPLATRAQPKAMPVIGFLSGSSAGPFAPFVSAFRQGLGEQGFLEGKNLAIEYRWAEGHYDRLPALAADLVDRKVDVLAAIGLTAVPVAKAATKTIPIVFSAAGDPVELGFVASMARPGGNLTGTSILNVELVAKRIELISELVPQAKAIALLVNPAYPRSEAMIGEAEKAARARGLELVVLKASNDGEIDAAFASLAKRLDGRDHTIALVIATDAFLNARREQLVALTARHAIPAVHQYREYATAGGLMSFGASFTATLRQVGIYTGRIIKGAKPADLPVFQPTTYELIINLKTAKALGLKVLPSLFARANEVIE